MFTKTGTRGMIDSVSALKGSFKRAAPDQAAVVEVTMVYSNAETGTTYGSCPVQTNNFTPRTIEALHNFLACAEEDYGKFVFLEGSTQPFGPDSQVTAESREGLKHRGLGEG